MYNERQREWTTQQVAEAAQDALDNWEWDVYLEDEQAGQDASQEEREASRDNRKAQLEAMTDPDYIASSYADDDGVVRIEKQYGNIWSWLDERMESSYASWLLVQETW